MKLKRAILIAVVMYVLSFVIGLVAMLMTGFDPSQTTELPTSFFVIGLVISVVLAFIFSLVYFRGKGVKASAKEGFYFGLVLIAIGFILDLVFLALTYVFSDVEMDIVAYYSSPIFWLALMLVIVVASVVGKVKGKK